MRTQQAAARSGTLPDRWRVGLIASVAMAMVIALLPPPPSAAQAAGFPDVPANNVHRDAIVELAELDILLGYPDGTFRPGANITRAQMASVIARAADLPDAPAEFSDVPAGYVHAGAIGALVDAGVIQGYPDGTFRPGETIRRDHSAVFLARWLELDPVMDAQFDDLADSRYAGLIHALWRSDIARGTTSTTFSPLAPIRRDQTASLVHRTIGAIDAAPSFVLTILHTNDGESALLPDADAGFPGAARFVADVKLLQTDATGEDLLQDRAAVTISSGDNYLAGPRLNASLDNEDEFYDAYVYTEAGFDAMTIGNHEFDFGPDLLVEFIEATDDIPFLSANLDFSGEPALAALESQGRIAGSTIVEKAGRDIGIIGATYENLGAISSPRNVVANEVLPAVQAEVDALQSEGVDIIILSSHLQDLDTEIALVPLLSGVDAVVGGGGGESLGENYPLLVEDADGVEVPIVTVPGNYTDVGKLLLRFDDDGELLDVIGAGQQGGSVLHTVAIDGPRDSFIAANVEAPVAAYVAELANVVVGTSQVPLDGRRQEPGVRDRETNLGSLLADSMLWTARERATEYGVPQADVALQNGGGIRNDGVIPAGNITELDTFNVAAFFNVVSVAEIDGATLKDALERSVQSLPSASGAHGQWGGVRFSYDTSRQARTVSEAGVVTPGQRIVNAVVTRANGTQVTLVNNGTLVAGSETFVIASIDFLLSGQDGYTMFTGLDFTRVGTTYQAALADHIRHLGTITADGPYRDVSVNANTFTRFGPSSSFTP
jgi:2',3'-cyclic-nucleotide 2'-phosphodiesterase (5'-nucleotidase family)